MIKHFYLKDEVRNEQCGFMLSEMVVLVTESGEKELEILQSLHQHARVRIKEPQGEPLQDQIQTADHALRLCLQVLR